MLCSVPRLMGEGVLAIVISDAMVRSDAFISNDMSSLVGVSGVNPVGAGISSWLLDGLDEMARSDRDSSAGSVSFIRMMSSLSLSRVDIFCSGSAV